MDLEDYRQRFRDQDTIDLVELWEEPMPDPIRELLREEIGSRRYRLKSLPPHPPAPAGRSFSEPRAYELSR